MVLRTIITRTSTPLHLLPLILTPPLPSLIIGLFGLVGILGVCTAPFVGRGVDKLHTWFATLISIVGMLVFQAVQTGAGGISVAAVIIACFGIDVFRQMQQVSLTSSVFGLSVAARSRLNAVLLISVRQPPHCVYSCAVANSKSTTDFRGSGHRYICWHCDLHQIRLETRRRSLDGPLWVLHSRDGRPRPRRPKVHLVRLETSRAGGRSAGAGQHIQYWGRCRATAAGRVGRA